MKDASWTLRPTYKLVLLLLLLALWPASLFAQRTITTVVGVLGTIAGQVTVSNPMLDMAPEGVSGAVVQLLQNGTMVQQATTDSNGNYNFLLEPGFYDVDVNASGLGRQTAFAVAVSASGSVTYQNFGFAQPGTISGTITRADTGAPIEGALVNAIADGLTAAKTLTDVLGNYSLSVPSGSYEVGAVATDFVALNVNGVNVTPGTMTLNVYLQLLPR